MAVHVEVPSAPARRRALRLPLRQRRTGRLVPPVRLAEPGPGEHGRLRRSAGNGSARLLRALDRFRHTNGAPVVVGPPAAPRALPLHPIGAPRGGRASAGHGDRERSAARRVRAQSRGEPHHRGRRAAGPLRGRERARLLPGERGVRGLAGLRHATHGVVAGHAPPARRRLRDPAHNARARPQREGRGVHADPPALRRIGSDSVSWPLR